MQNKSQIGFSHESNRDQRQAANVTSREQGGNRCTRRSDLKLCSPHQSRRSLVLEVGGASSVAEAQTFQILTNETALQLSSLLFLLYS